MKKPGGLYPPVILSILFISFLAPFECSSVSIPPLFQESPPKEEVLYFVSHDQDKSLDLISLPCIADGLPPPNYFWLKNGKKLEDENILIEDNSGSISFTKLDAFTEGVYQCVASNSAGAVYSDLVYLKRAFINSFAKAEPKTITVKLGQPLKLPCVNPGGYPKPTLHWVIQTLDGRLTSVSSPRATVDSDGTLWFSAVTPSEASRDSLYACAASSVAKSEYKMGNWVYLNVSLPANVDVHTALDIPNSSPFLQHANNGNITILKGDDDKLYCLYGGYPNVRIRWWRSDGHNIASKLKEFGKVLVISNAEQIDEGVYHCVASNSRGTSEILSFTVDIQEKPVLIEKPARINQPNGETATFHCRASGQPPPHISWTINGEIVENKNENMLVFDDLKTSQKAVIGCNASNIHGYDYATGFINVLSLPPEILAPPENVTDFKGTKVILTCEAYGAPDPEISWQKVSENGHTITLVENEDYEILPSQLVIKSLSKELTGLYRCIASNKYDSVYYEVSVSLKQSSHVSLRLASHEVNISEDVIISCTVTSDITLFPKIIWQKNARNLRQSERFKISELNRTLPEHFGLEEKFINEQISTLSIKEVEGYDAGIYSCIARSPYDEVEDSANLNVFDVPNTPLLISMECGTSEAIIKYRFVGRGNNMKLLKIILEQETDLDPGYWHNVHEAKSGVNHIAKVRLKPGRVYAFRVRALNAIGYSAPSNISAACPTDSRVPANNPFNVKATSIDSSTIHLTWEEIEPIDHSGPGFRYEVDWTYVNDSMIDALQQWQKIIIEDWEQTEVSLPELIPDSIYYVRVLSANDLGYPDELPKSISARTKTDELISFPTNLRVRRVTANSVILSWIPVEQNEQFGEIKGYEVMIQSVDTKNEKTNITKVLIVDTLTPRASLSDLRPESLYSAKVRVFSDFNDGPYSEEVIFKTEKLVKKTAAKLLENKTSLIWNAELDDNSNPPVGAVMNQEEGGKALIPEDPLLWTWFIVSVMAAVTMLFAVFFSIWVYNYRLAKVAELRKKLYDGIETNTEDNSKDDPEAPPQAEDEEPLTAENQRKQMAALMKRQETSQSVDSFASNDDDFAEYGDEVMGQFSEEGSLVRLNEGNE